MSDVMERPAWQDSLSPRNTDSMRYKVKVPHQVHGKSFAAGDYMTVWPQGEKLVNINGGLTRYTARDVAEWVQAGIIIPW